MNQRERMLSGLPYKAWLDGLEEDRKACKQKIYDFNQLPPSRQSKEAPQMIKNIFGKTGENVWVEAPFHCDYGWNIEVGENFYSNYNLTILDVGKVTCRITSSVKLSCCISFFLRPEFVFLPEVFLPEELFLFPVAKILPPKNISYNV